MSIVRVATNFNIDIEFTAPPFYRRLVAWVIDIIILLLYTIIASRLFVSFVSSMGWEEGAGVVFYAVYLLLILPFLLYHVVLEATMNGQSIGKKIMKIKVISENGGRPSLSQLIIRWLIRTSDYTLIIIFVLFVNSRGMGFKVDWLLGITIALLFADLILVNTRNHQRLGDILAHTVLINEKQKEKITDTIFLEVTEEYKPQYPEIMQLSDRDINALKGIIDTSRKHKDYQIAFMAAEKIKAHLKIDTHLEPEEFLEVLLKDYNYLSAN
ncbi:MAG TPA: RDD family protein [Flavisolibacter sp.]|nr:RDD family protein [Flavisolibacter sp.]